MCTDSPPVGGMLSMSGLPGTVAGAETASSGAPVSSSREGGSGGSGGTGMLGGTGLPVLK